MIGGLGCSIHVACHICSFPRFYRNPDMDGAQATTAADAQAKSGGGSGSGRCLSGGSGSAADCQAPSMHALLRCCFSLELLVLLLCTPAMNDCDSMHALMLVRVVLLCMLDCKHPCMRMLIS